MADRRSDVENGNSDLLARRFSDLVTGCRWAYLGLGSGRRFEWLITPSPDWLRECPADFIQVTQVATQLCSRISLLGGRAERVAGKALLAAAPIRRSSYKPDWRSVVAVAVPWGIQASTLGAEPSGDGPPGLSEDQWRSAGLALVQAVCARTGGEAINERGKDAWRFWSDAGEEERQRISRDIHDEMSQIIAGIFLKVQRWERVLPPGADQARREISSIKDMVHEVVVETSRMISELRQPLLDRGLWEALGRYVDQWGRENEVLIERRLSGDDGLLSLEQQIAVYRIVQEALNNIRRHARAKRVNVTIRLSTKSLHGRIVDDGIGFDLGSVHGDTHFGLTGMSERASLEGGRLRIDSSPGMGTTLIFWLPLERGY